MEEKDSSRVGKCVAMLEKDDTTMLEEEALSHDKRIVYKPWLKKCIYGMIEEKIIIH